MNTSSEHSSLGEMFSSFHFFAVNLSTAVCSLKSNLAASPGRGTVVRNVVTFPLNRAITAACPVMPSVLTSPDSLTVAMSVSLLSYCARRVMSSTRAVGVVRVNGELLTALAVHDAVFGVHADLRQRPGRSCCRTARRRRSTGGRS